MNILGNDSERAIVLPEIGHHYLWVNQERQLSPTIEGRAMTPLSIRPNVPRLASPITPVRDFL